MNAIKNAIYTFNTDRQIAFYDKKVGIVYRLTQVLLFTFILYDLFTKELYFKTEIPSGYTTMWAETGELYDLQSNASIEKPDFCDNVNHNYIYSLPYWDYRNNSCINLHYSEMYQKGENEIFFQTYFTENKIILKDCDHFNYTNNDCLIIDRLDGQCFCQNYKNFYSVGVEGMRLVFNHLYTTTFESGSNIDSNGNIKPIKTIVKDVDGKTRLTFNKNDNIDISIGQWLALIKTDLDDFNTGVKATEPGDYIPSNIEYPRYRMSGLEIILKVNFYNMKKMSNFDDTICVIEVVTNKGWSSKGSKINYINYPDLLEGSANQENIYVDRYRYGIKFKFIVSGLMGKFDWYMLITHLVSIIVLTGVARSVLSYIVMYLLGKKSRLFKKYRVKYIESDNDKHYRERKTSKLLDYNWDSDTEMNIKTDKYSDDNIDNYVVDNDILMNSLEESQTFKNLHFHKNFSNLKKQFSSVH